MTAYLAQGAVAYPRRAVHLAPPNVVVTEADDTAVTYEPLGRVFLSLTLLLGGATI